VFEKIDIGPDDMDRTVKRVNEQFDIQLLGVRKLLRAWLLELLDLSLAKEEKKKVVYYGYPSIQGPGMAIKAAGGEGLYVGCPDAILCHTVGMIFDKLTPMLEAGENGGFRPDTVSALFSKSGAGHLLWALFRSQTW